MQVQVAYKKLLRDLGSTGSPNIEPEALKKARQEEPKPIFKWWQVDEETATSLDLGHEFQGAVVYQITVAGRPSKCFVQTIKWV